MKIAINSRIYQNKNSGVPYYVYLLFSKILELDKQNNYIFFQTQLNKTIGHTKQLKLPDTLLGAVLFDTFFINSLIKRYKVDIVHGASVLLPVGKKRGVKYTMTVYDLAFLHFPKLYSTIYKLYHTYSIRRSLKKADKVVCISESTKRDVIRFFGTPEEKLSVIYPGINDVFWTPPESDDGIVKEPYFFSVTTHPSRKNIFSVLRAMAKSEYLKRYTYAIAGLMSESHKKELEDLAQELGIADRVRLLGFVSEEQLKILYRHAVFFIYPSFYEGFGLPVIESMAQRCPVLSADNSSLPEVNPNKEWMFDAKNIEEMTRAMERAVLLSEEQRQYLIESNLTFANQFTWEASARKMIEVFESLKTE
jgi:glycosyltransferase involved in cell wall biosynthesis